MKIVGQNLLFAQAISIMERDKEVLNNLQLEVYKNTTQYGNEINKLLLMIVIDSISFNAYGCYCFPVELVNVWILCPG